MGCHGNYWHPNVLWMTDGLKEAFYNHLDAEFTIECHESEQSLILAVAVEAMLYVTAVSHCGCHRLRSRACYFSMPHMYCGVQESLPDSTVYIHWMLTDSITNKRASSKFGKLCFLLSIFVLDLSHFLFLFKVSN